MRTILAAASLTLAASALHAAEPGKLAHVETRGDGDTTLILVPGLACDWSVWDGFMDRNTDRYTMHAVTIPGMAGAESPPDLDGARAWMEHAAASIVRFTSDNNLEDPILVGHSLGATMAIEAAIMDPDAFSAVVLVDGYPAFPFGMEMSPEQREQMASQMMGPQLDMMTREMFEQQMEGASVIMVKDETRAGELKEIFLRTDLDAWKRYLLEGLRTDLRPGMDELDMPVIAMAAMNRQYLQPGMTYDGMMQYWKDVMSPAPEHQVVFFEDTRHFIMDDRPEAFDAAILAVAQGKAPQGVAEENPEKNDKGGE